MSFVCQSRTSLIAANSALQAEDFYTFLSFLVTSCRTTADARFRTPAFTPGTYFVKCAEIDIYSHLQIRIERDDSSQSFNGLYKCTS